MQTCLMTDRFSMSIDVGHVTTRERCGWVGIPMKGKEFLAKIAGSKSSWNGTAALDLN